MKLRYYVTLALALISSPVHAQETRGTSGLPNADLSQMPANTVKCNPTGSLANVQDCTALPLATGGLGGSQAAATANQIPAYPGSGGAAVPTSAPTWFDNAYCNTVGFIIVRFTGAWTCSNSVPLDAKWLGATGNGSTDDTTALQNWINLCQTNSLVCHLSSGTYKYTTALAVTPPLTIEGVLASGFGGTSSVLQPATNINGIVVNGVPPVVFRDFGISYPSAAGASTAAITLTASGAANLNYGSRFERLVINNALNGYSIAQAEYFVISKNIIQNLASGGNGLFLDNSSASNVDTGDSTIEGSTIATSGTFNGILISSFAGLRVVNNKIIGNNSSSTGIALNLKNGVSPSLLTIIGNSIENVTSGIILQRAGTTGAFTNVIIANNEFEPGAGGVAVNNPTDANGVWLNNVMISNNIIFGPSTTTATFGYIVKASSGVQIIGNLTISNSTTNGFEALATAGSNNCTLGPNGHGAGLFVASDLTCTTTTNIAPN